MNLFTVRNVQLLNSSVMKVLELDADDRGWLEDESRNEFRALQDQLSRLATALEGELPLAGAPWVTVAGSQVTMRVDHLIDHHHNLVTAGLAFNPELDHLECQALECAARVMNKKTDQVMATVGDMANGSWLSSILSNHPAAVEPGRYHICRFMGVAIIHFMVPGEPPYSPVLVWDKDIDFSEIVPCEIVEEVR